MDSIYLVMPAYNEEENIGGVVEEWYSVLEGKADDSRLVIADAGSSDKTHEILLELKRQYDKLEILDTSNKFHGPKVIALYNYAIEQGADFVFQTDSDGQTDASEFQAFWDLRNSYDAILGKRLVRGDGKSRAFVEHVVCLLLRVIFGVNVPDANAPFRLIKTDMLKKHIYKMDSDYNIPNIMLTVFFVLANENIAFKSISFRARKSGQNSINMLKIIKIGLGAIKDFYWFKSNIIKETREI